MTHPGANASAAEIGQWLRRDATKICIFGREHIGDVVNITGAIGVIRRNCPNAQIAVAVGERAASVLKNSPDFDLLIERPWNRTLANKLKYLWRLSRDHFDAAFLLDEARSHVRIARWAGIPTKVGVALPQKRRRLTFSVPFDEDGHDSRDQSIRLLEALEFEDVDPAPRLFPSGDDMRRAAAIVDRVVRPIVLIHPGASEPTRRWPGEHYASVINELGVASVTTILTGSPAERPLCDSIAGLTEAHPTILTDLSILGFAALAARADAVLVGDTGPMHVAAAVGTPVVALYGPTYPHRTGPYGGRHQIIQGPCSCVVRDWQICTHACMRAIEPAQVVPAVLYAVSPANR